MIDPWGEYPDGRGLVSRLSTAYERNLHEQQRRRTRLCQGVIAGCVLLLIAVRIWT